MSVTWHCQHEESRDYGKPRYRLLFFMNGSPKMCEGPRYFYIFFDGQFRAAGKNFGDMAILEKLAATS